MSETTETHAPAHVREHDVPSFDELDRGFGKSVAVGYAGGLLAIASFMLFVIHRAAPEIPWAAQFGVALGVAFWIGIMGGVVAVGMWATKHEHELFHR